MREKPAEEARDSIAVFVSGHHRRGVKQIAIVFDPAPAGEEAGSATEAIVNALTLGASAALVRAFSTAHESRGGSSALALLLT